MSGVYVIRTENNNTFKAETNDRGHMTIKRVSPLNTRNREYIGTFTDRDTLIDHFKYILEDTITFMMPQERCRELVTGEQVQL